ncbi:MAG: hypothetical protein C4536_13805 [Actinobacteria bacterium]|nr:MAG: hypothetical protein C4536_13805 [Actinomycetota bacterium]
MRAVCEVCGVPKLIAKTHSWRDGCIVDNASGNANFCFYEVSFHNALFAKVGAELGMPLDNIILNAGRQASARVIEDLLSTHPLLGKIAFKAPLYHLTQKLLVDFGMSIGIGRIEILEHKKGKRGLLRYIDPYNLPHCTAILLGSMDVIYDNPVAITLREEEDGSFLGELKPVGKKDAVEDEAFLRLASEDLKPRRPAVTRELPACKKCGVPRDIGSLYSFDLEKGIITEQLNRERAVLLGVYSLNSILREFENELGRDIADLFIRKEEESFKKKLAVTLLAEELKDMQQIRDYCCLRGLGMLTEMVEEGDKTSFTIENAFIPPMVAGRFLALCEYRHGRSCGYDYSLHGNTLSLSVSPA